MAVANGFGKVVTSGSVFMYDTGDTVNSYRGEPTTNLNPYTLSDSGTDGSGQGNVGTRTILSSNHVRIDDVNSNTRQTHLISGLTGGATYTISIEFKKISGTPTFRFQLQNYLNGSYNSTIKFTNTAEIGIEDKEGWQLASWTFVLGAGMNGLRIWYQDGADYTTYTHSFELRNPQLEQKSHATPYTPPGTTRSATQGLLPIVGSSTIDLSSVSFDSSAQFLWDGTDDTLSVNDAFSHKPGLPFTYEIVVTPLGSDNAYDKMLLGKPGWHTGIMYQNGYTWFRTRYGNPAFYDAGWYQLSSGNYYHISAVYVPGTSMKFYVNGVLNGENTSVPSTLLDIGDTLNIGGSSTNYSSYVKIPVAKVYNRALSAAEVKQNYNKYKTRFNLS